LSNSNRRVIKERYQVIGKLGFGSTSTAWLARDMDDRRYVMLKIFVQASSMGQQVDNETYSTIFNYPSRSRRDKNLTRYVLYRWTSRQASMPSASPTMGEFFAFLRRNPIERLPSAVIAVVLHRLFF
ncbi:hypothetical protein N7475_006551, partial [Penicillium sp. IBT 31633x]